MRPATTSVRRRSIAALGVLFALFTLGLMLPVHWMLGVANQETLTSSATRLVDSVRRSLETSNYLSDITRTIQSFGDYDDLEVLLLADLSTDTIAAASATKLVGATLPAVIGEDLAATARRLASENHPGAHDTPQRIYAFAPIFRSHALESDRHYIVIAALNKTRAARSALRFESAVALAILCFAALVTLLASRFVTRHLLRPLTQLGRYFDALGHGDDDAPIYDGSDLEWLTVSDSVRDAVRRMNDAQSSNSEFARNLALATQVGRLGVFQLHTSDGTLAIDPRLSQSLQLPALESIESLSHHLSVDDRSNVETLLRLLRQGEKAQTTIGLTNTTGRSVLVRIVAEPDSSSTRFDALGLIQDVTESAKLDRLKDDFIATVSHELRTPLTAIKGSNQLLLNGVLGPVTQAMQENLTLSARNISRLENLINDILDIEKLSSGRFRLDLRDIDAAEALHEAIAANQPVAATVSVELALEVRLNPHTRIVADKNALHRILTNFLSNAIKFSPDRGRVILRASLVGRFVEFTVIDFGPGVPEEFRPQLFTRFSQAQTAATRTVQKGTGLGLAISRELAEAMNGEIGFDTTVGRGTAFWVRLPRAGKPT